MGRNRGARYLKRKQQPKQAEIADRHYLYEQSVQGVEHEAEFLADTYREIRGGEALDLIQAMTSGHRGCLSTVHATLPIDTLNRLETMALMGDVAVPIDLLRSQIASAIDTIVQVSRFSDGSRRVTHVSEVRGYDRGTGYRLTHSFERSQSLASAE